MTAFPKAAIQNVLLGADLNVRLWPKADPNFTQFHAI
jgi:hypothetical protein